MPQPQRKYLHSCHLLLHPQQSPKGGGDDGWCPKMSMCGWRNTISSAPLGSRLLAPAGVTPGLQEEALSGKGDLGSESKTRVSVPAALLTSGWPLANHQGLHASASEWGDYQPPQGCPEGEWGSYMWKHFATRHLGPRNKHLQAFTITIITLTWFT